MKNFNFLIAFLLFSVSAFPQINIFSDGKIGVGTSTPPPTYYQNVFNGSHMMFKNINSLSLDVNGAGPRIWSSTGDVVFYNTLTGTFNTIQVQTVTEQSDSSAKTNVKSISNGLSTVLKLRGVSFNFKKVSEKKRSNPRIHSGVIAQEIEKVIPDAVYTADSTGEKSVSYSDIIPYLIEAIKEQQTIIENQDSIIKSQLNDLVAIKTSLADIQKQLKKQKN